MKKLLAFALAVVLTFGMSTSAFANFIELVPDESADTAVTAEVITEKAATGAAALDYIELSPVLEKEQIKISHLDELSFCYFGGTYYIALDTNEKYTDITVLSSGNVTASLLDYNPNTMELTEDSMIKFTYSVKEIVDGEIVNAEIGNHIKTAGVFITTNEVPEYTDCIYCHYKENNAAGEDFQYYIQEYETLAEWMDANEYNTEEIVSTVTGQGYNQEGVWGFYEEKNDTQNLKKRINLEPVDPAEPTIQYIPFNVKTILVTSEIAKQHFLDSYLVNIDYDAAVNLTKRLNEENPGRCFVLVYDQNINIVKLVIEDNFSTDYSEGKVIIKANRIEEDGRQTSLSGTLDIVNNVVNFKSDIIKLVAGNYSNGSFIKVGDKGYSNYDVNTEENGAAVISTKDFSEIKGKNLAVKSGNFEVKIKGIAEGQRGVNFLSQQPKATSEAGKILDLQEALSDSAFQTKSINFGFLGNQKILSPFTVSVDLGVTWFEIRELFESKIDEKVNTVVYYVLKDGKIVKELTVNYMDIGTEETAVFEIESTANTTLGQYQIVLELPVEEMPAEELSGDLLYDYLNGYAELTKVQLGQADMNRDGKVTLRDAMILYDIENGIQSGSDSNKEIKGAYVNQKYERVIDTVIGAKTYSKEGTLPKGMKLSGNWYYNEVCSDNVLKMTLSGTPTEAGTYNFSVSYKKEDGATVIKKVDYTVIIGEVIPFDFCHSISVDKWPYKTVYKLGETVDLTGMKVSAVVYVLNKAGDAYEPKTIDITDLVWVEPEVFTYDEAQNVKVYFTAPADQSGNLSTLQDHFRVTFEYE